MEICIEAVLPPVGANLALCKSSHRCVAVLLSVISVLQQQTQFHSFHYWVGKECSERFRRAPFLYLYGCVYIYTYEEEPFRIFISKINIF
jgi:hypothetical protein